MKSVPDWRVILRQGAGLLVLVLAACELSACGGSMSPTPNGVASAGNSPTTSTIAVGRKTGVPPAGYFKGDEDKDEDDIKGNPENDDGAYLESYGAEVAGGEARAIALVVKRYMTAAAARDGASGCRLLYSALAAGLAGTAGDASAPSAPGRSRLCAVALARLFAGQHAQLIADDVATMAVTDVRVRAGLGLAVLAFRKAPESEILLEQEGGVWKIDALLDSLMP